MMVECLVCGNEVGDSAGRFDKKYCGPECKAIAEKVLSMFNKATISKNPVDGKSRLPVDNPPKLASKYMYAFAKVKLIESLMEERGFTVPDAERIVENYSIPSIDDLEENHEEENHD